MSDGAPHTASRRACLATAASILGATAGCIGVPVPTSPPPTGPGARGRQAIDIGAVLREATQLFVRPTDPVEAYEAQEGDLWLDTSGTGSGAAAQEQTKAGNATTNTSASTNTNTSAGAETETGTGMTNVEVIGLEQDVSPLRSPDISRTIVSNTDPATWGPPVIDGEDVWADSSGMRGVGLEGPQSRAEAGNETQNETESRRGNETGNETEAGNESPGGQA